jgi:hypothetical protein
MPLRRQEGWPSKRTCSPGWRLIPIARSIFAVTDADATVRLSS